MAFPTEHTLTEFVTPLAADLGLDVEAIKVTKAGKKSQVVIRVDGDNRPSSDDLEKLSGIVGDAFDQAEAQGELNFGAGYTLEISTPGVDLPLTQPRHFRRNRGRLVTVKDEHGNVAQTFRLGALDSAETSVVAIVPSTIGAKGTPAVSIQQLANITPAMVEIEFAEVPAAQQELVALDFEQAAKLAE